MLILLIGRFIPQTIRPEISVTAVGTVCRVIVIGISIVRSAVFGGRIFIRADTVIMFEGRLVVYPSSYGI